MKKNILTIATGKKIYIDLACNLANSFFWHHPNSDIKFYLVTDRKELIVKKLMEKLNIIEVLPGELGDGFSSKLFLDKLAPDGQTLFIDSDCLIFSSLQPVFKLFEGHDVSVIGGYIGEGEWFGEVKDICNKFNLPYYPKFNGGVYYIKKGPIADAVYNRARQLEKEYDEIGFTRLRGKPNDEVIMALAMQLNGQTPIEEDGTLMSDPQACPGGYYLDVIKGRRWLYNPPAPHKLHQAWYPFTKVKPIIVHFLGYYTNHYPYKREVYRLDKAINGEFDSITLIKSKLFIEFPSRILIFFKNTFRPLFHVLFGARKIKVSERIN